ncbi:hypothetical protein NMG60_11021642 [Bertholletia excelsa]
MDSSAAVSEHGNHCSTLTDESVGKLNAQLPKEDCADASPIGIAQFENGVVGVDEFSPGNEKNGHRTVEGDLSPSPELEGKASKTHNLDDISASIDVSPNSNCDRRGKHDKNGNDLLDTDGGGDDAKASGFPEIEVEKKQVHVGDFVDDSFNAGEKKIDGEVVQIICPHSQLPKPEAPRGVLAEDRTHLNRSNSSPEKTTVDMPMIGKFIREKSNSFSAAIAKRLSSLKDNDDSKSHSKSNLISNVTEFNLSGLKVVVKLKNENDIGDLQLKGRISFFSRSNCRDCSAVRSFFRERGLKYAEINIDVYPTREMELVERTGSSSVPQIFLNEKLLGGLVVLNSLRNSGLLEQKLKDMLGTKCPDDAPAPPVYGFDDPEEEQTDEMVPIVRVLRQKLPIQDRLVKMKIVRNCFSGAEMVEAIIHQLDCGRKKAVDVGQRLVRKHFIHHVFGDNEFEDGSHFYRFLEHEPFIPRCFNFRGSLNDNEPKFAAVVNGRLTKLMCAILESYASEDRQHLDYVGISNSEEFRRYVNLVQDLQRVNLFDLSADEKLAFFLNLHNAMVIHAVISVGHPGGVIDRRSFFSDFLYLVGGHPYSLTTIKNGILRSNRRPPYSLVKCFGGGDKHLELALPKVNPLIHFGLCNGTRSCPVVRFFTPQGLRLN